MVTSGSVNGTTVAPSEGSYVDWQLQSQDTVNNRSVIRWQAGWRFPPLTCRGLRLGKAIVNGTTVYDDHDSGDGVHAFSSSHLTSSGDHTPKLQTGSGTFTINHNSDGTKTFSASITMTGWNGGPTLVSAGSGSFALPTIPRNPNAPSALVIGIVTQTSVALTWTHNPADGLPNTSYTIGYGTSSSAPTVTTTSTVESKTITGLTPGVKYYFWVKATNSVGTGPYSASSNTTTIAGARVNVGGVWKQAIPYVRDGGVWKVARPWERVLGVWGETI
jgi:hypothetical protein